MGHKNHNKQNNNDYLNPERAKIEKSNKIKELNNIGSTGLENIKDIQPSNGVKMKGFY
ncbi:hypothetical protein [Clostridium sp.]|uniref:hypothetical protein n=1 Tax=Clostridium sp. TaxID=1506 RepID=UPI001A4DF5DC|nr:hypothetical protein [Clostridium sp.]MBK5239597.1 hypothetical protein [Clostridium sp.]